SGKHVLTATTYSKSVLRAAAGQLADELEFVDYFPSYELITSPVFEGAFFGADMRAITSEGIDFVMGCFFREFSEVLMKPMPSGSKTRNDDHWNNSAEEEERRQPRRRRKNRRDVEDALCDEKFLDWFTR